MSQNTDTPARKRGPYKPRKPKTTPPAGDAENTAAPDPEQPAPILLAADGEAPPPGAWNQGMKDPAVIRWHLAKHPDRMAEIYGAFDWEAHLIAADQAAAAQN